ncbi:thiamine-phosphate pyrophosphorylase [Dyadobacter jejuensis]|uniref:Thiamine-phosphate pyrophosphorylase n=2 Tax=Dyadobacter jejuensis TaxID=1082580 RepID=A0A316AMC3_9BACT|nr:thiamine-phosphate pyrophosphorylase [Dyadobacter jejuensis]
MKLLVITSPHFFEGEARLINALFERGLACLHLRKPEAEMDTVAHLIGQIDTKFHSRLTIHHHHALSGSYAIGGIHFTEQGRRASSAIELQNYVSKGYRISTSVHQKESLSTISPAFNYSFFGPVFDSISKPGYSAAVDVELPGTSPVPVYALGGVTAENIIQLTQWGFSGAAVLGYIWQNPHEVVQRFLELSAKVRLMPTTS